MSGSNSSVDQTVSLPFEEGQRVHRQHDLHDRFGGNRQSGIAPCANHPYIFLFSSPMGDEYGYEDGWRSTTIYIYSGEGQYGDMAMTRGNRAIRDHVADGRQLHLFKKISSGLYEYIGRFVYQRHEFIQSNDVEKRSRQVIQFELRKLNL